METPRPSRHDKAIQKEVATALAPKVLAWGRRDDPQNTLTLEEIQADLEGSDITVGDGYALARALERHGYMPDSELVDLLDEASSLAYSAHRRAVERWAAENPVQSKFKVGDQVRFKFKGKDTVGIIADVATYEVRREYLVDVPGCPGRPLIAWEAVEAVTV